MQSALAAQLQAVKSLIQVDQSDPQKRPFTRPSILYNPKEAADIDTETVLNIALSGLEILIGVDERFRSYKNDLFSTKSRDLDRELMTRADNDRINTSIASYLRLLSGYLHLPASHKTLEYLIRRYKVHVYNIEDLILSAFPYHETHAFVRIMQLINTGNTRWKFLDGVKTSGAPPPRSVIVQQCIRDMGVLETLCSYASSTKKAQSSRPVISFCTAVIIETLGSITSLDSDAVKRILPFVVSGLQPGTKASKDHKAGALTIVGLLANKVELSPKLVNSLMRSISEMIREDAKETTDLQLFRLSLLTLIILVQSQSVEEFPKKALESLKDIRDIPSTLMGLSREFNIDRFLVVLLEALVDYSSFDPSCHLALVSILETVPVKGFVERVVRKILLSCVKISQKKSDLTYSEAGSWAKNVLVAINKRYPSELRGALQNFLEDKKVQAMKDDALHEVLWKVLDGDSNRDTAPSDSKIWLAMHHPKAEVRRATLAGLNTSCILKAKSVDSEGLISIQDAILHQLRDEDLTVVQSALSVDGLSEILDSSALLETLYDILKRCLHVLCSSAKNNLAGDIAFTCLKVAFSSFRDQIEYTEKLSAMLFPLLLIIPKSQQLNLKVLKLAKEEKLPFYRSLADVSDEIQEPEDLLKINMEIVNMVAGQFFMHPEESMHWLTKSFNDFKLSKTFFFLVVLRSFTMLKEKPDQLSLIYQLCFPALKSEWETIQPVSSQWFNKDMPNWDLKIFLDRSSNTELEELNANILICTFWRLLETITLMAPENVSLDDTGSLAVAKDCNGSWISRLRELFIFFATSSQLKNFFKEHLHDLVTPHKIFLAHFLPLLFAEDLPVEVQVESLHWFAFLCSQLDDRLLLAKFPSILVPLASDNQDTRTAAMGCIDGLYTLWSRVDISRKKNGSVILSSNFLGELLPVMIQQKKLIISDKKFLPSFLASLLGTSHHGLSVPEKIEQRFDQSKKQTILASIVESSLKLSDFGKLAILSMLKESGPAILHIKEVESLLSSLLQRRRESQTLSYNEVKILCVLLEICAAPVSSSAGHSSKDHLLDALKLDGLSIENPAASEPTLTVLKKLGDQFYSGLSTETQGQLFEKLVLLYRNANGDIQNATREALLRLKITASLVCRMLDIIVKGGCKVIGSESGHKKKKSQKHQQSDLESDVPRYGISFLSSLFDILLLKKDITNRDSLLGPLFELLGRVFSEEWAHSIVSQDVMWIEASSGVSQTTSSTLCYIQQTLLIILEDVTASLVNVQDDVIGKINIRMLIDCAHSTKDGVTRNHVFSLLSTIAKITPEMVLEHIVDILTVLGESTVTQVDNHSHRVFEDLIAAVIPCWLSKMENTDKILQIFVDVLPQVAEHRRLSIVLYLLRTLGESKSLASLLNLLFCSLTSRKGLSDIDDSHASNGFMSHVEREWEYSFSVKLCEHYSSIVWLPAFCLLLKQIGKDKTSKELYMKLLLSMQLILLNLQDPEFAFKLESSDETDIIQKTLEELMSSVVSLSQLVEARKKKIPGAGTRKELKECMNAVLKSIAVILIPSSFFNTITNLLGNKDEKVIKKALVLLSETVKDKSSIKSKHKGRKEFFSDPKSHKLLEGSIFDSFQMMCAEVIGLIDEKKSSDSLKLVAISTLGVLANRFPANHSVFITCLAPVAKVTCSQDLALSSSCLQTVGALINTVGQRALPQLPLIMENVIKKSQEVANLSDMPFFSKESLLLSTLVTLESILDKLGAFVNPYLGDILELLILRPDYVSGSDLKLKSRADLVRRLITEKIPVRLALPPLLKLYSRTVDSGDSSLMIYFEMLSNLVKTMDKLTVNAYYGKIFDLCLASLDLRRQHPDSVVNIVNVEKSIINGIIALTMKLTETTFKPLFIRSIEWAESGVEETADGATPSLDRGISFYGLVNKLAESHRSLFVPYFKYMLEGCVRCLTNALDLGASGLVRKKKKSKTKHASSETNEETTTPSLKSWHLRALVLASLHKCFLYDNGNLKFLDSSNFQVLLKPIVSQLVVDAPGLLEEHPEIASINEVDELLVVCIGQMAVTAGTDLLWKPLNHEVLMQTRSEKVRSRLLGLRIVKYLLENLKEEYLVLVPETIPFLGELLEDVELPVKSLAQDIIKEMETMSGESLRDYL
ncbi:hypothetical protein ACFE04_027919 [Oxalis oulophora]